MEPRTFSFLVIGEPKAQPRTKAWYNPKIGRAQMYDGGAANSWKGLVVLAWGCIRPPAAFTCPLGLDLVFHLPRPKGHSGKHGLRASAPVHPTGRPDVDNLAKAVMDALTDAMAWTDDKLVVDLHVVKRYPGPGESVGALVTIRELPVASRAVRAPSAQLDLVNTATGTNADLDDPSDAVLDGQVAADEAAR